MQVEQMQKVEMKNQQLEMEVDVLIGKIKENEAEDLTSIRYSFDQLLEDLEIKTPSEDLSLAEQIEDVFEVIKKRNRNNATKKVRFNPNLTSESKDVKSKTWPKGEEEEQENVYVNLSADRHEEIIRNLEIELEAKAEQIRELKEELESMDQNHIREVILKILRSINGPQAAKNMQQLEREDMDTLLLSLQNAVTDLMSQRDVEVKKLADLNQNLNSRYRKLEQTYEDRRGQRSTSAGGTSRQPLQPAASASSLLHY